MFVLTEKIKLPRRVQLFNDYAAEDAAQARREDSERWINRVLDAAAAVIRNARK